MLTSVGVLADADATLMLILVALVSFLVQVYSLGYLADEPPASLGRYYTYQSLFAFSMMGLVLAPNFVQLFICWELVGLCSYLLIGYWYPRPEAARAAVKAFWITKAGDVVLPDRHRDALEPHRHLRFLRALRAGPGRRGSAGRPRPRHVLHLPGRRRQVGPVPVPRLAARRDGGPHPGLGPHPRRHHGDRGRLPALPHLVPLPADARRARRGGLDRRLHRAARGHAGVRAVGHQAGARLLDRVAARLHDGRDRGRLRGRGLPPPADPRGLQGAALPGRGRGHPRGRQQRHLRDGRPRPPHAADLHRVPGGHAVARGHPVLRGLLLQGGDPGRGLGGRAHGALRHAGAGRLPHRLLHVPGGVHRLPRRPGGRAGGPRRPRRGARATTRRRSWRCRSGSWPLLAMAIGIWFSVSHPEAGFAAPGLAHAAGGGGRGRPASRSPGWSTACARSAGTGSSRASRGSARPPWSASGWTTCSR